MGWIFLAGDFKTDTGPATANRMLRKGFLPEEKVFFSDAKSKAGRIVELVVKGMRAETILLCSSSRSNLLLVTLCRIFRKKLCYLMHGYGSFEYEVNQELRHEKEYKAIRRYEKQIFSASEKIICVSSSFMKFMQEKEPLYREKFCSNFNAVDLEQIEKKCGGLMEKRKKSNILSVGGGMRQKNNLNVCRAIERLNREGYDFIYTIIGKPYTEKDKICAYSFVEFIEELPHEEVLNRMSESYLYIQNSCFETFGIAILEALAAGCNILITKQAGVTDVLEALKEEDLIDATDDVAEITEKIKAVMECPNRQRIYTSLRRDELSCRYAAKHLLSLLTDCDADQ